MQAGHTDRAIWPSRDAGRAVALGFVLPALFCVSGCQEDALESLAGRWEGVIVCAGGEQSGLSVGFSVEGASIGGAAFTTVRGSRQEWGVSGRQIACIRYVGCADDTCSSDAECAERHVTAADPSTLDFGDAECPQLAPQNMSAASRCGSFGQCSPCTSRQDYPRLVVLLANEQPQLQSPLLSLARDGVARLSGTALSYCQDEALLGAARVVLEKELP